MIPLLQGIPFASSGLCALLLSIWLKQKANILKYERYVKHLCQNLDFP